ncbi:hypothetical protein V5O48_011410 [Marasmius crinis-equi]|uniref:UDP-Glycosyltransferase/glycogen phosphorylase n=1 Tax=Marasmius crinis-equi TaxID=585013 RepID=A0ABR3F5M7_9AGAR
MSTKTFRKHIFCHAISISGHTKPLVALGILVAEMRKDVAITIFTNDVMYTQMMNELAKLPRERLEAVEKQINILQVVLSNLNPFHPAPEVIPEFEKLYKQSGTVTCLSSGKTIDGAHFPPPCVAVVDPFADYALEGIRSIATREPVPIVLWITGTAGASLMVWGPECYGGRGDFVSRIKQEVENGKTELEAFTSEVAFGASDNVLRIPGYPPCYDYERYPQAPRQAGIDCKMITMGYKSITASEGILSISSSVLEKESIEAWKEHFETIGKGFFAVAPLSIFSAPPKPRDPATERVLSFLESMKDEFGDKSVLYFSFGSITWPSDPAIFNAVIDQLIGTKMPFILAHPSPMFQPDQEVLEKIMSWAPQELILAHSATGWFLTHGGWNSLQEALLYKVPLIFWPTTTDGPLNAMLLTLKFHAGFELIEVRTGKAGAQKPYRLGDNPTPDFTAVSAKAEVDRVLKDIQGEKGVFVRKNFEDLSAKIAKVWDDDGEARNELNAFLCRFVD